MTDFSPLAEGLSPQVFPPGQLVYLQGSEAEVFYYLRKGTVKSFLTSEAGNERLLTVHKTGDLMGEASFFDGCPRVSSAAAVTRSEVVAISRGRLAAVFAQRPDLALPMLQYLARTVRLLSAHVDDISFRPAGQRVARYLRALADRRGELHCSHEEIGNAVGVSRVTVSRTLSNLAAAGVIATGYRTITVRDFSQLQALSEDFPVEGPL